jgi:hypothetical protein
MPSYRLATARMLVVDAHVPDPRCSKLSCPQCRDRTLLMYAVQNTKVSMVEAFLLSLLNVGTKAESLRCKLGMLLAIDDRGRSVFHYAAHAGHPSLRHLLDELTAIASSIDVFAPAYAVKGAMIAVPESLRSVELAERGKMLGQVVLNHCAADSMPLAVCQAAFSGDPHTLALFTEAGCLTNPMPPLHGIDSPLICAVTGGCPLSVRALVAKFGESELAGRMDVELQWRGKFGETALHRAAVCHDQKCFDLLLHCAGALDVITGPPPAEWSAQDAGRLKEAWQSMALMRVACMGDEEAVKQLLAKGAAVRFLCLAVQGRLRRRGAFFQSPG